jgi:putative tryptophan/tyrosine transport system substrate-binding protein
VRRRDILILASGAAVAWSFAAPAQQADRTRRIGVLMALVADDPQGHAQLSTFRQALRDRGWTEGRNLRIDIRWSAGDAELNRRFAAELVALAPDIILAGSGQVVSALQKSTRTVPIVFTVALDPVARGFIESMSQPGGNTTGFLQMEYSFSGKWLELLKQVAPHVTRVAVFRDIQVLAGPAQLAAIQSIAPEFGVVLSPIDVHDGDMMEHALSAFAREGNGGLIVTASTIAMSHRDRMIALAARYRLPAVYPTPVYVIDGGLVSYGPVFLDQFSRAAEYVDRILKGAKPGDLPVQAPVRFEMALNLRTAKALGLDVPRIVLLRANQIID